MQQKGRSLAEWPEIPLQPPGSHDCSFYATAYLCRLLGHQELDGEPVSGERVKRACLDGDDGAWIMPTFPERVYGASPAWCIFDLPWEERRDTCYSFAPGFREWVRSWAGAGFVGYAVVHVVEWMTHIVIVLDADQDGVFLADPARGLVRDEWEAFESYVGDNRPGGKPTHVEAWYALVPNSQQ